jgi:hypothetical protein
MNPLGILSGMFLGIFLLAAISIGPPLLVLFSSRRLGLARWPWFIAATLPGALLWFNLKVPIPPMRSIPPWAYLATAVLVYLFFRRVTKPREAPPAASASEDA